MLNLADLSQSPLFNLNENGRARGSFGYQNHFANYLSLCLALAIGLLLSQLSSQKTQWQLKLILRDTVSSLLSSKLMLRLAIVVMVIGLVLSRSRDGQCCFFCCAGSDRLLQSVFLQKTARFIKAADYQRIIVRYVDYWFNVRAGKIPATTLSGNILCLGSTG